jgi:hypothetical protein
MPVPPDCLQLVVALSQFRLHIAVPQVWVMDIAPVAMPVHTPPPQVWAQVAPLQVSLHAASGHCMVQLEPGSQIAAHCWMVVQEKWQICPVLQRQSCTALHVSSAATRLASVAEPPSPEPESPCALPSGAGASVPPSPVEGSGPVPLSPDGAGELVPSVPLNAVQAATVQRDRRRYLTPMGQSTMGPSNLAMCGLEGAAPAFEIAHGAGDLRGFP